MLNFLTSTVGKKYLMGASALVWVGFVFAHMAGNLLMFVSPDAYNAYGHALTSGMIIYVAETGLILALLTHVFLGIQLTLQNRAARPQRYAAAGSRSKGAVFASRTMAIHGTIILIFLVSHLITFKFGTYYETTVNGVVMRDLYRLLVEIFAQPVYVIWYVISLVLLGFHLSHGVGSMFQSFGLLHPTYQPVIRKLSWTYAIVVVAGFLAQPIVVFFIANEGR
ncbi:MAG: succinate dehydrogenase cytochrome b subunit [Bdellovibrionaceae bacterium]|nr:succinate dehydrogenase cytochrome b subunit [Pseudobdellovibrionaceae bacterium]MBX3033674.1 succinate dehydrogenase cytochrome b subunit [Pseudobdellovibrionaceae bacterium]